MNTQTVLSRGFQRAELVWLLLCAAIWAIFPQVAAWLLPLALLPVLLRLSFGVLRLQRGLLDIPLLVFLVSAVMAAWVSYHQPDAWNKFWLLLAAVLLYYALASQGLTVLRLSAFLLVVFTLLVSVYFLISHDWQSQPADSAALNRLGLWWMQVRPLSLPPALHPNFAGGWIATFLPFLFYFFTRSRRSPLGLRLLLAAAGLLALIALLLTSSRAAWAALAAAGGAWLLWHLSDAAARRLHRRSLAILRLALVLALLSMLGILLVAAGGPSKLASYLPGPNSAVSRLEIDRSSLRLVVDFPLTGGGLRSFPGLYSHYMLAIPFFLFDYAHNLYLDLAVEQGLLGLLTFLWIYAVTAWLLLRAAFSPLDSGSRLRKAIAAAGVVLLLHGFVDDPFYGIRGTPLLFVLPGMAMALWRVARRSQIKASPPHRLHVSRKTATSAALLALVLLAVLFSLLMPDVWRSNMAALEMARLDLYDFPSGAWTLEADPQRFNPARQMFLHALETNPGNATALHRLGLIALAEQDFTAASGYLEHAHVIDPGHRGVLKRLAYLYVWTDRPREAYSLLIALPEAQAELAAYASWWQQHGRLDLASRSHAMAERLRTP